MTGGGSPTRGRYSNCTAVSYVGTYKRAGGRGYVASFGCLYYGLQRPEEVIALSIAERAGNSIKMLMERYAWALDEEDYAANKAIGRPLGDDD